MSSTMQRARSPVPRTRSPVPAGRSPTGRSPGRSRTIREPSPGALSARRERRNSFSSFASGADGVRRRRSSISPVPAMPRGRGGGGGGGESEQVRVVLRVRPFNSMEEQANNSVPCLIPSESAEAAGVTFLDPRNQYAEDYEDEAHNTFQFDRVFYPEDMHDPPQDLQDSEQHEVYQMMGPQCLTNLFESYNSCVFAYGQTGSGKTHTMMGGSAEGIIPRFCRDLLTRYEALPNLTQSTIKIQASFIEIYCENLYDLMCPEDSPHKKQWVKHGEGNARMSSQDTRRKLSLRQHPVHGLSVAGATTFAVSTYADLETIVRQGMSARSTASTSMNDQSSRSHAMFQITVEMQAPAKTDKYGRRVEAATFSTANMRFVDLAGSENLKKSGSNGDRMHESIHINTSLLALRRVIDQLIEKGSVPGYRDSKLTRLLSDCLGGNSKTWFLACVSPSQLNSDETKNTLRYASKATRIVNRVSRNMDVGARMEEDLVHLREELALARGTELDELKSLIAQYEGTLGTAQQDMEEKEREMREAQEAADKEIALAKEEVQATLKAASQHKQRAEEVHSAELMKVQQQAESFRRNLQIKEKTFAQNTEELQKTKALAHEKDIELRHVEETLSDDLRKSQDEKKVWEEIAMDMEKDLIAQKRSWTEEKAELLAKHEREMEAQKAELVERFKLTLDEKEEEWADTLAAQKKISEDYKAQLGALNDSLIKTRLKSAAEVAAQLRQRETSKKEWEEEAEEFRRLQSADKSKLANDVRGMQMSLEEELQQRKSEMEALKRDQSTALIRERERAERAHTQLAEAEIRASNVISKFGTMDNEIRGMEEVHGKASRLLTAVEEKDFTRHEELINLVKEVSAWGKQLKSIRTNFTSLVSHKGRPEVEQDFIPSNLDAVDPSQGRHRRSGSSRRLRKI